jgi:tripartite ATP-independent transporter DctM subunit
VVLSKWLKKIRSGLGIAAVLSTTIFAALCGSSPATAAAIGRISIKEMRSRGWDEGLASGLVAAGGTTGIMIPPSITLAVYGIITETSIVDLFIAGVIPGLINSALFIIYILICAKLRPHMVGASSIGNTQSDAETSIIAKTSLRNFLNDLYIVLPPVALILIIFSCLYLGITTPTEMGGLGALIAMFLIILNGRFNFKMLVTVFKDTTKTSVMTLMLVIAGLSLSYVVSVLGLSQKMAVLITTTFSNKWIVLIVIYVIWFVLGMIIDPMSMTILTIPFVFPILIAYGFHPVWLGIVSTVCVEIAMITPPVGMNLFILSSVTGVEMKTVIKGSVPFVLLLIISLILLTVFPKITLILVNSMR